MEKSNLSVAHKQNEQAKLTPDQIIEKEIERSNKEAITRNPLPELKDVSEENRKASWNFGLKWKLVIERLK